jgi:hypothetical protein
MGAMPHACVNMCSENLDSEMHDPKKDMPTQAWDMAPRSKTPDRPKRRPLISPLLRHPLAKIVYPAKLRYCAVVVPAGLWAVVARPRKIVVGNANVTVLVIVQVAPSVLW